MKRKKGESQIERERRLVHEVQKDFDERMRRLAASWEASPIVRACRAVLAHREIELLRRYVDAHFVRYLLSGETIYLVDELRSLMSSQSFTVQGSVLNEAAFKAARACWLDLNGRYQHPHRLQSEAMADEAISALDGLLPAPIREIVSPRGRTFAVEPGMRQECRPGSTLGSEHWKVLLNGEIVGALIRTPSYPTPGGEPRWSGSLHQLRWSRAFGAPTGLGDDVRAFDTPEECAVAWAKSADELLDWAEGK